jgi:hypothetical protein
MIILYELLVGGTQDYLGFSHYKYDGVFAKDLSIEDEKTIRRVMRELLSYRYLVGVPTRGIDSRPSRLLRLHDGEILGEIELFPF